MKRYEHNYALVSAVVATDENMKEIIEILGKDAAASKLSKFEFNRPTATSGATVVFRYKDSSQEYTLSTLEESVLVVRDDGTVLAYTKADFESEYHEAKISSTPVEDEVVGGVDKPEDDVIIASEEVLSEITNIKGKTIAVKELHADSTAVRFVADGDVSIRNLTTAGHMDKAVTNAAVSINTDGDVTVKDCKIGQGGYNAIEIGLAKDKLPKNVVIENVEFTGEMSNNAILIFGHQEDAVITIRNCHFRHVSNAIRISNKANKRATINIVDCTCDRWDTDPTWAGPLLLQDYTSTSAAAVVSNRLFGKDKLTINITNMTGPYGKVVMTTPEELFGSADASKQIASMFCNKGNPDMVPYAGNEDMWPTINIR